MDSPPIKSGDTIGVMAPSSFVEPGDLDAARRAFEAAGYKIILHPQCFERHGQSAGTHESKIAALHELWADQDIKAVIAAGGGNRALHLLEMIDYGLIAAHQKVFMGFSDGTALLNAIYAKTGLVTCHGPVFRHLGEPEKFQNALQYLSGRCENIPLDGATVLHAGTATGKLIGGNLSVFQYLVGTAFLPDCHGAILFLEDCGEETSRIDRMLLHLKRAGLFNQAAALIFGAFTDMKDTGRPFGFSVEELIREHTAGLDIPILINAPFGHGKNLPVFPVGKEVRLESAALPPFLSGLQSG